MTFQTSPERLGLRARVIDALLSVSIGGTISHAELLDVIGHYTQWPNSIKSTALRTVAIDHGVVFENIRGVGYRRVGAGDVARVGAHARSSIGKKAKHGVQKIIAVLNTNSNSMSNEERISAHAEVAMLGMARLAVGRSAVGRAEKAASEFEERHQKPPKQDEIARALLATFSPQS